MKRPSRNDSLKPDTLAEFQWSVGENPSACRRKHRSENAMAEWGLGLQGPENRPQQSELVINRQSVKIGKRGPHEVVPTRKEWALCRVQCKPSRFDSV